MSAFHAIVFTDLKDSTVITTTFGEIRALHLLHIYNVLIRDTLREYRGNEVKHTPDGIMAAFANVVAPLGLPTVEVLPLQLGYRVEREGG